SAWTAGSASRRDSDGQAKDPPCVLLVQPAGDGLDVAQAVRTDGLHVEHGDPSVPVGGDPVLHESAVTDERNLLDEGVGHHRLRPLAVAAEEGVLNLVCHLLEPVAPEHVVVEVLATRPHAPEVQGEHGGSLIPEVGDVVANGQRAAGDDLERREVSGAPGTPGAQGGAPYAVGPLRPEVEGQPAFGALSGHLDALW